MDTTKLIVEYLIVGILVSLSLIFLGINIVDPAGVQSFATSFNASTLSTNAIVYGLVLLPVAYGVGVIVEFAALAMFDFGADKIKTVRLKKYFKTHTELLAKSPIVGKYLKKDNDKSTANMLYGEMRFFAMYKSSALHAEIEAHLNRLRILRAMVLAEIFFIIGLFFQANYYGFPRASIWTIVFLLVFFVVNLIAVIHRQDRYARAIERSYIALMAEEGEKHG
jgi:hypothetical protein